MIAIIDYGVGNLRSVEKAFAQVAIPAQVTSDPVVISKAPGVVLPGVGAFADCMDNLRNYQLADIVKEFIFSGKPLLGICVGKNNLVEIAQINTSTARLIANRVSFKMKFSRINAIVEGLKKLL